MWMGRRSTDKRYPGDNRLIGPKSPYRRTGLAPQHWGVAAEMPFWYRLITVNPETAASQAVVGNTVGSLSEANDLCSSFRK
jgi:hypothetical protein